MMNRLLLLLRLGVVIFLSAIPSYVLAARLEPGNVLVRAPFSSVDYIAEWSPAGKLVQTIEVPYHGGARGIVVDGHRYLHTWNGAVDVWLSTYDAFPETWTHHGYPGWNSYQCFPCMGIDVLEPYLFVTDMGTDGRGLIRFEKPGFSGERFGVSYDYSDLTIGQDGLLYARRADLVSPPTPTVIDRYDPIALTLLGSVTLSEPTLTIAVDAEGSLFGCRLGAVNQYDGAGNVVATFPITTFPADGEGPLYDIDLSASGQFVMGTNDGYVILTDRDFNRIGAFFTGGSSYVTIIEGNRAPAADGGGPYSGTVDFPLTLSGDASADPNGDNLSFHWDFGDGSVASVMNPTHTFTEVDSYLVVLTVSDGASESRDSTYVRTAPPPFAARVAPNPLGPSSRLIVQMSEPGSVTVELFDARGRRVKTLVQEGIGVGVHSIPIDARSDTGKALASGVYYYVIGSNDRRDQGRITILR